MTPRAIKGEIKKRNVTLLPGLPEVDQGLSSAKRASLFRDLTICRKFLKGSMVIKLAKDYDVTHQRISQMVDHGLKYMMKARHLIDRRTEQVAE